MMVSRRFYRALRRINPGPLARVAIVGGFLLHAAAIGLMSVRVGSIVDAKTPKPFVSWVDLAAEATDPALRVQALLFDSEPLFMPTRWNFAGNYDDVASLEKASEMFRPFPPRITLDNAPLPPRPLPGDTDPWQLRSSLADSEIGAMRLFGRTGLRRDGFSARLFAVEARDTLTGRSLRVEVESEARGGIGGLWRPAVFSLQYGLDGPIGEPLIVESSGVPDLDMLFAEYLGGLDFYRRLQPGYYTITVGP